MTKINYLAVIAVNLLAIVFAYKRYDFELAGGVSGFWTPLLISVIGFNLPGLLVGGIDYLANKKFNAGMFNRINYFIIGFILLVFFFPGFLKMGFVPIF